jgi:hypothetical protein
MKMSLVVCRTVTALALIGALTAYAAQAEDTQPATDASFEIWLKDYIPTAYAGVTVKDFGNGEWYQAKLEAITVSWAKIRKMDSLGRVEALKDGKPLFIAVPTKEKWAEVEGVVFYEGVGYYVTGYVGASMGEWNVKDRVVVQFNGDPKKFVEDMVKAYKARK